MQTDIKKTKIYKQKDRRAWWLIRENKTRICLEIFLNNIPQINVYFTLVSSAGLSLFIGSLSIIVEASERKETCQLWPMDRITLSSVSASLCFPRFSTGTGRFVGEVSQAQDSFHQSAATGIRKPIQAQQVPVPAQTLWGGHFTHAEWDSGEKPRACISDG